jgi:hypothetical protein
MNIGTRRIFSLIGWTIGCFGSVALITFGDTFWLKLIGCLYAGAALSYAGLWTVLAQTYWAEHDKKKPTG